MYIQLRQLSVSYTGCSFCSEGQVGSNFFTGGTNDWNFLQFRAVRGWSLINKDGSSTQNSSKKSANTISDEKSTFEQ